MRNGRTDENKRKTDRTGGCRARKRKIQNQKSEIQRIQSNRKKKKAAVDALFAAEFLCFCSRCGAGLNWLGGARMAAEEQTKTNELDWIDLPDRRRLRSAPTRRKKKEKNKNEENRRDQLQRRRDGTVHYKTVPYVTRRKLQHTPFSLRRHDSPPMRLLKCGVLRCNSGRDASIAPQRSTC